MASELFCFDYRCYNPPIFNERLEHTLSGEDNGPRDTVWEIGDVMPGRDRSTGTDAVVENILQGFAVRERFGCDLAFVLRLHRVAGGPLAVPPIAPFDPAKPCPCGLHGKSYGYCCRDKGIHASGTRYYGERRQGTCRVRYRKSSRAWSKVIPGFGSCGMNFGKARRIKRSTNSLMAWS